MELRDIKLGIAIHRAKKLTERLVGVTEWQFTAVQMFRHISYTYPQQYLPREEVLCKLLKNKALTKSEIYSKLGLDMIWGDQIIQGTLNSLSFAGLVERVEDKDSNSDDSAKYELTKKGEEFITRGFKECIATQSNVELFYLQETKTCPKGLETILSAKFYAYDPFRMYCPQLQLTEERYRILVAQQHPELHNPEEHRKMVGCEAYYYNRDQMKKIEVSVAIVHNYLNDSYRPLVFLSNDDEMQLNEGLSKLMTQNKKIFNEVLDQVLNKCQREGQEATQKEIKEFMESSETNQKDIARKKKTSPNTHFSTLEFEAELYRVFNEFEGDIFVVSPWFGEALKNREYLFKTFLNRGGKLYLCASNDENNKYHYGDWSVDFTLRQMHSQYPKQFFYGKYGIFHTKLLLLVNKKKDIRIAYSGSFNILSFKADYRNVSIREEEMNIIEWNSDYENKVLEIRKVLTDKE